MKKIIFSIASRLYLYKLWKKFIKTLDNSKHKIYFSFDDQKEKKNKLLYNPYICTNLKNIKQKINKVEMDHCRVTHGKY